MSGPVSITGAPIEAARAVCTVLGVGEVQSDARSLPGLLKKRQRVVFVFRDVERAISTDDPAAALAGWNAALEALFDLALRPRALERVFVLRYEDLVEPAPGCLDALLSFAGVPPTDAVRGRVDAIRGEPTSGPLSAEACELIERHARRDLAAFARGLSAESRLCWSCDPSAAQVRELAREARASRDAMGAEAERVRALRE